MCKHFWLNDRAHWFPSLRLCFFHFHSSTRHPYRTIKFNDAAKNTVRVSLVIKFRDISMSRVILRVKDIFSDEFLNTTMRVIQWNFKLTWKSLLVLLYQVLRTYSFLSIVDYVVHRTYTYIKYVAELKFHWNFSLNSRIWSAIMIHVKERSEIYSSDPVTHPRMRILLRAFNKRVSSE